MGASAENEPGTKTETPIPTEPGSSTASQEPTDFSFRPSRHAVADEAHVGLDAADGPNSKQSSQRNGKARPSKSRPGLAPRHESTISLAQIDSIFSDSQLETDMGSLTEERDGFFDALFLKHAPLSAETLLEHAKETLPRQFDKTSPLSVTSFVPRQWRDIQSVVRRVTTTRSGILLLKCFVAFFAAYILCLVPVIQKWLGRYNYIMPISVIINHPARPFGSQLDGTLLTIVGTAAGLGWGVVGLLLSTSTLAASAGYGGILALFLALFMATVAWMRSFFTRFYQAILCSGIAVAFTTLAQTSSHSVKWNKLSQYAIPWLFGQAIALIVNTLIFPDFGDREFATVVHSAFDTMQDGLVIPRPRNTRLRSRAASTMVALSQACRDMRLDLSIARWSPADAMELRNLLQGVLRSLLSMKTETHLFDDGDSGNQHGSAPDPERSSSSRRDDQPGDGEEVKPTLWAAAPEQDLNSSLVASNLARPTKDTISCMKEALLACDAALMSFAGYRRQLGPSEDISSDLSPLQARMSRAKTDMGEAESTLLSSGVLPASSVQDSDIVRLFVFARHVREAAVCIENLMAKVSAMQLRSGRPRLHLPSYPFWKAIHRTNAQIRHDRGGITAGSYHLTFVEIARLLDKIKARQYKPTPRGPKYGVQGLVPDAEETHATMDADADGHITANKDAVGYQIWRLLHVLEGFESKFALKVCLVTSLLAVPSYLVDDSGWWDKYEAWWAVATSWAMMHPRVGGNLQDMFTRAFCAILGGLWSSAAYAAGNGSPYVTAAFAAILMIPMLYRFTQSSHPRSGLVGCLSFTVISLRLQTSSASSSHTALALREGLVFLVGTTAPILVNWILWPFIARNELRYSLSSMLFFLSVVYRSVVARYIYFQVGMAPSPEDIERSVILEGRLREGFVRIRQLMVMTRHEPSLRAPFDPLPYSALANACERFFEFIIAVRQSAMFYNPGSIRDNPVAAQKLLRHRRDAVAAILGNLYILGGALRSQRKVPRYLPSAAAARKKLLVKTVGVEEEIAQHAEKSDIQQEKQWSTIYSYSYNESLTGCVAQLEELEKYTKLIVGEQQFTDEFKEVEDTQP